MKKIFKYIAVVVMLAIIATSCKDENRFPAFQTGVNARVVVSADHSFFSLGDISNSFVSLDIYSVNNDIDHIDYSATYTDVSSGKVYPAIKVLTVNGNTLKNGKFSDIQITAASLATAFSLPGGAADLGGGDSFTFTPSVKLKDGRTVDASTTGPSITSGTNASFTTAFVLAVACPSFVVADAIGTYTLVTDPGEWATEPDHQVEIVAGPGDNQVTLKDALGYNEKFDMIVTVDPVTSAATVAKQKTFNFDFWDPAAGYGIGSTEGGGTFYSCAGFLTVSLLFTVDAGSFGTYKLEFQKN